MAVVTNLDSILQFVAGKIGELNALKYKAGDSLSGAGMSCYGWITGAGKAAVLRIPLPKLTNDVSSFSASALAISVRGAGGGYLGGSENFSATSYITSASISQGMINITLNNNSGWGQTNNTPVTGMVNITGTFS